MSGTSLDGIDAGLVEFKDNQINLIACEYQAFSVATKHKIQQLSQVDTSILLADYGRLDTELGHLFAEVTSTLLQRAHKKNTDITAIGSHGQTVYHSPDSPFAFSLQIADPNIIAERTGITTIADFRRRDIAVGGQGAPLVPAFHHAIFSQLFDLSQQTICIVNIGGIANISCLSQQKTIGFDTGMGNTLMDYWINQHLNDAYDKGGAWAKSGQLNVELLSDLKQDDYFLASAPKSTGKEYFSPQWLEKHLDGRSLKHADVQKTLCQLTADTITDAIKRYVPQTALTLVCGGGVYNDYLMSLLQKNLDHPVESTQHYGVNPDHVESMAFAWLARQTMQYLTGNLPGVTGANKAVILGGIYTV